MNQNIKHFRFVFILFLAGLTFSACKKEKIVILPSRQIVILSAKTTGLTSYEVKVRINLAEGQTFLNANLVFEDITVSADSSFDKPLNLSSGNDQIITVTLQTNRLNHDYAVTAFMQTDKGKYTSDKAIIRSLKNTFRIYMISDPLYPDPENQISIYMHKQYNLVFLIDHINPYKPASVEVNLNGTIPIDCNIDFSNSLFMGVSKLPPDLLPGVYDIHVFLDGMEFISEKKFKILEGTWSKYDTNFIGDKTIDRSWFLFSSDLYLVGGHYPNETLTELPVWKFNMQTKQWQRKNNFPGSGNIAHDEILPFNLQYNNQGYVLYGHDTTLQIWKYLPGNDSWTFVSTFPSPRLYNMISFAIQDHLYLGGGLKTGFVYQHGFWSFDLVDGTWTKLNDVPILATSHYNVACVTGNKAYVFEYSRKLWEYDPGSDAWVEQTIFPGPRRTVTNLVASGNDLYVIGGEYYQYPYEQLDDCWKYSISSGQWELKSFLPYSYNYGISFYYGGKIYAGYGWTSDLPELLQFVP